ncbi:MAG: SHOCT domain-containing protein [Elainellaceae cyanobacterium]
MTSSLNLKPRYRSRAIVLAFAGVLIPGLHKFYLGEWRWGLVYLVAATTPISRLASLIEGLWYCSMSDEVFDHNFNRRYLAKQRAQAVQTLPDPKRVESVAEALRKLDQLRKDGLISEYEFEQKRRQWLDRID